MPFILVMYDQYHTYLSVSAVTILYQLFIVVFLSVLNSIDLPQIITVVFLQYSHCTSQLL
jgi:hypothetical protein